MKRSIVLNALFALVVLGLGWAIAANNITKSVQLSQDPSGPIGFDTQSSVYFPVHVNNSGSAPTLTALGTSSSVAGTDMSGEITLGTTPGIVGLLTFRTAYASTPFCVPGTTTATVIGMQPTPNGILIFHSLPAASKIYYTCTGGNLG